MDKYRFFLLLIIALLLNFYSLFANEEIEHETSIGVETAYYFDNHSGYGENGGFIPSDYNPIEAYDGFLTADDDQNRTLGSGWGALEFQVFLDHKIKTPFIVGDHNLTKDNNLEFDFRLYIAPVATYLKAAAVFTPIAFMKFEFGGMLGTGWNAVAFNGLGLNTTGIPETKSFPGVVTELWSSLTLQFDLAAFYPGEWSHLVFLANWQFKYKNFSIADKYEPWQWLADSGENLNGTKFKGTYFLGYRMPLLLNLVGFLVETDQHLGNNQNLSTMSNEGWGSDFIEITFGPLIGFSLKNHHEITMLFQFQTGIDYRDDTIFNTNFVNREYEDTYVKMNRIALSYKYIF